MANNNIINASAFTQGFITRAHNPSPIDTTFCVRNMGIAPLNDIFGERGVSSITTLISYGHTLAMGVRYDLVQIQAHVALDLMQINVRDQDVLTQAQSQAHLVDTTRALCADLVVNGGNNKMINFELPE